MVVPIGLIAGGIASDPDLTQDIESAFTGGMTSEEEALLQKQMDLIGQGYGQAMGRVEGQYFGPTADKTARMNELQAVLDDPYYASKLTPEEYNRAQSEIAQIKDDIYRGTAQHAGLQYTPDWYVPTTEYDVPRYQPEFFTPTKDVHASEEFWSKLDPEKYDAPEYESAAMQDRSEAAKALADVGGMAAQREALAGVQDIYKQGGLTAIDRARLEESRRRNQMIERASREAILADMERRGQVGSGVELASRLANQQGSAERMAQEALGVEGMAQLRAERALGMAGGMGRDLAEDVFRRDFQTGSASDEINRFNTQGARDVQADVRRALDTKTQWERDKLQRDIGRLADVNRYNAMMGNTAGMFNVGNQNTADQWNTANQIARNIYGADAANRAAMINTQAQTDANRFNTGQAWNQLQGFNTQQQNLGNMDLAKNLALSGMYASVPTADWGQFANNLWNLHQAIGGEVQKGMSYGMGGPGGAVSGIMPGGGGGSQGNMNPIQTGGGGGVGYVPPQTTRYGY